MDVSEKLPELNCRPGITVWRPTVSRDVDTTFATYEEFINSLSRGEPGNAESKMTKGHWPPTDAKELGLNRWFVIYS